MKIKENPGTWVGVSTACVLMVAVFPFSGISDADCNLAVSVAHGINGILERRDVGIYSGIQFAGGIMGPSVI